MASNQKKKNSRIRNIVVWVACIIIAITFLVSGTGKLGDWSIPGQTLDFVLQMLPNSLIMTDAFIWFYTEFIPIAVPALELAIALFLLVGFIPRFWAIITMAMTVVFMADNAYAIWVLKIGQFASCSCFGFWEKIFGGLTPAQSLVYDIVLFGLALAILLLFQGGIFESRQWLQNLGKKKEPVKEKPESK